MLLAQAGASFLLLRSFALTLITDVLAFLLMLSALLVFLVNGTASRGRIRLFWMLQVASWGLSIGAQLLWIFYEVVLRKEVPNPFVGDILLFMSNVPVVASLLLLPHLEPIDARESIDAADFLLLLLWWLYLYVFFVIPWQYIVPDEARYGLNYDRVDTVLDIVVVIALGYLCYRGFGRWKWLYGAMFFSQLLVTLSGQMANHAISAHLYYPGSWYDVPYAAALSSFTLVGLLGLLGCKLQGLEKDSRKRSGPPLRVARVAVIAVLSLPFIAGWAVLDRNTPGEITRFRELVTLATMFLMAFLVFLQEHRLRSRLAKVNRELEEASLTDPLTGARNRRFFDIIVPNEVSQIVRSMRDARDRQAPLLVFCIVDVDNFKEINDRYGHEGGDSVLVEIARRIGSVIRKSDVIIRWGGDEFLVVSRRLSQASAERMASRVLATVANEEFSVPGTGVTTHVTCSLGWAAFPWLQHDPESVPAETVLALADRGAYEAKQAGRNRAVGMAPAGATTADAQTIVCSEVSGCAVRTVLVNRPLDGTTLGLSEAEQRSFGDPPAFPLRCRIAAGSSDSLQSVIAT